MSAKDIEFAVNLTGTMNWGLAEYDFNFIMSIEPEGCFILLHDSERIGLITSISFGKIGWFGNLIVNEKYRGKGAGSLLVNHCVKYLRSKNVETVGLYAYIDKIPFYRRLGFKYDSEFIVLKGKGICTQTTAKVKEAEKGDVEKIIHYDQLCFRGSREKLLKPLLQDPDNLCYVSFDNRDILGYVIAKNYGEKAEIGPLVCHKGRADIAADLLKTSLNSLKDLDVSMCINTKEPSLINMLRKSGFGEKFRVARMFSEMPIAKECIYAAESLERG